MLVQRYKEIIEYPKKLLRKFYYMPKIAQKCPEMVINVP